MRLHYPRETPSGNFSIPTKGGGQSSTAANAEWGRAWLQPRSSRAGRPLLIFDRCNLATFVGDDMDQKSAFVGGEADAYFKRNAHAYGAPQPQRVDVPEFFAEYVQPGDRVLEIGCASGNNVAWIAKERGARAVGIDPSEAAIATGRAAFPSAELHVGTADRLPFQDQSLGMVLFGFCLAWIDRDLIFRCAAEADRVLRYGGFLGIWDFDPPYPMRRAYHHRPGLWSYKADYSSIFLGSHAYQLTKKWAFSHSGRQVAEAPGDRCAAWLLRKSSDAYAIDPGGS